MDNAERLSSSSIPLISVGNFTFGGTGKTPFVIYLADMILKCTLSKSVGNEPSNCIHNSHKIVDKVPLLLTRGYGNDEWKMFQQAFPEFPVAIGSDRIMQGKKAVAKYGKKLQCILVEDGLQQWKVKRDLQIVMVDALHPFGNGKMIPCGSLREKPQDAIARTDIVVIHHANLVEQNQYKKLRKELETMANPEKRMVIAGSRLIVDDLVSLHGASSNTTTCKKKEPVKEISQGKIALVFCGVGNAASVEAVVKNIQGWYQVQMEVFPDHYSFVQSELEALQHQAQELQNSTGKEVMILTTEKDYHRSHQLMKKVFSSKNKAKQTVEMRILKCRLEIIDNKQQVHTKVHKILCLV